ncbi:MAG: hypothetical protein DBW67_05905 [SAR116 cluster bacterium]|nr:hypothetical protein [Paracoccaceae bacterium]RCL79260.1 MAG: hypothetical protein DBW67_05905 [SAR116 cluster bacterium]HCJ61208.1 hypothetical protein [Alphaproteobacteria bacterium]|tara:strand:- start:235 stop:753 length:519 start_codon:yes stop_codon:yes gene_type:complete
MPSPVVTPKLVACVATTQTATIWLGSRVGEKLAVKIAKHGHPAGAHIEHEARILSQLEGIDGIPQLVWLGEFHGKTAFAYHWIDGLNLRLWTQKQNIRETDWEKFQKVLMACHQENIVHGDIKAGNCLLCRDGSAHFIDFGKSSLSSKERLMHDWACLTKLKSEFGNVRQEA